MESISAIQLKIMDQRTFYEKQHKIGNFGAKLLFYLLTILLPLYFDSRVYLALIEAKGNCYEYISVAGFIAIAVFAVFTVVYQPNFFKEKPIFLKNKMDLAMLFFALAIFISFLLSADKRLCLTGEGGFHCGTYMVLSSIVFYFFISRNLIADKTLWDMVFWVMDIIMLLIILHSMSIDVFGMHYNIIPEQYYAFLSTLGNSNSISPYICLMMPVGIVFYVSDDKKINRQFYGFFVAIALMATFRIQVEGVFIGLAFGGLFLFPYLFSDYKRFIRMFDLGIMASAGLIILSILQVAFPAKMLTDTTSITYKLTKYWIGIFTMLFCIVMMLILKQKKTEVSAKVRKICSIIVDIAIGAVIIGYTIYSALHFNVNWGSGRGDIWISAVKLFQNYSIKEKLFGLGTEMIVSRLTPLTTCYEGMNVANAHNNILEALLCIGILGLIAYFSVWISIVVPFFKKERNNWSRERVAYLISLVAYFGQSIVGNPYSLSVPLVFLMLALYRNQEYRIEKPVEIGRKKKRRR